MAGNSFLNSPFQSLIDEPVKPLPGAQQVTETESPDLSADVAPVAAPSPAPATRTAPPASLLPPESMRPLFEATAAHFKVPVNVLMAIAQQESSYNADATNKETSAAGIGQYMGATAKSLGINARDPNEAVPAIAMQLRERLDKGYDMADAVKEHFAGPDRKLWGEKTAAYGQEVLAKAGQIGQQLYGDTAAAPESVPSFAPGVEQNQFAPDRMARADYEKEFRALNPKANDAAVQTAMAQYDQQATARVKAKAEQRAAGPVKKIPTPEEFFDQRLNAKLQGPQDGVVPQLPAREQPIAFPGTGMPAPRPGLVDQARGDFGRGIDNLRALGFGTAGMAAEAAGKGDDATKLLDQYVAIQNDVAKNNPATIGSYKNIHDMGDAGRYAIEAVMENLPMILPSLVTGGVGAQAAKIGAQRLVGGMIESQVAKGIAREVAEKNAAQFIARRVMMGSAAGAAPATIGMETGSIGGDIYQETGQKRPGIALGYGIPAGLLDTLEPVLALRKIAGPVADEVAGGIIKRLGVEAGKQFIAEAGTEGLQTIIEEAGKSQASGKKLFTPELLDNVIDSALKGGLGGAGMGVASQGIHDVRAALARPQAPAAAPRIDPTMGDAPEGQVPEVDPVAVERADAVARSGGSVANQLRAIRPLDDVAAPDAPAGPLTAAIEHAADLHAIDPAPAPALEPEPPALDTLPMDELRTRLRDVAQQVKQAADPAQRKELMQQRGEIEKAISAVGKQASADSKPAVEPLSAGPFDDMKAANRMMQRFAEETGQPHEVVGSEGKFRIQPIEGARDGIDTAGSGAGLDGRERSSGTADAVGRDIGTGRAGPGGGIKQGEPDGIAMPAEARGENAGDHRTGSNGAADAAAAVAPPYTEFTEAMVEGPKRKPIPGLTADFDNGNGSRGVMDLAIRDGRMYPAWVDSGLFTGSTGGKVRAMYERAIAEAEKRGLRFTSDDSVTTTAARVYDALERRGYVVKKNPAAKLVEPPDVITARWRTDDGSPVFTVEKQPAKENAHVPERPQVPEEAQVARGEENAQPAAAGVRPAADAGTGAAPAAEGKLATRRALNAKQDEVVRAASEKLAARKAEKEAAVHPDVKVDGELKAIARKETENLRGQIMVDVENDQQGVIPGRPTSINQSLAKGRYSLNDMANAWKETRAHLREKYGATVTLYRAEAPRSEWHKDTQVVYMGDQKLASRFAADDRKVQAYTVPVDDIIGMNVHRNGYHEFIVKRQGEPMERDRNAKKQQPAEAEAPAPTSEPAREVPRSFMKKVKVDHDVYIRDERRWETVKVPAHTALKSVREDIGNLEALLKCMKG